jgi:predicted phage baseplate assembly protein
VPIFVPNLDDRSAPDLYAEMRARIPSHTPEWTNLNDADPGVTLLQLFAFLADNLLYRSNRIPEANRRKFLTLLGIGLQPASPGLGLVTFDGSSTHGPVAAGTVVRAGKVAFNTRHTVNVVNAEGHVFYKRPNTDLDAETLDHMRKLHEPFLGEGSELEFYDSVEVDVPTTGVPLPSIDLALPGGSTVDGSVWIALACTPAAVRAAANDPVAAVAAARVAMAGATLTIGIHPAERPAGATLAPRRSVGETVDPGLIVESLSTTGTPSYQRLRMPYAENVLDVPGVVDVVLPALADFVTPWEVDPSDEGTGDFPPLVQDGKLAARIVTWLRIRYRGARDATVPGAVVQAAIGWVGINAARIVQAVQVTNENVGLGTGAPDLQVRLANGPVLVGDVNHDPVLSVQDEAGQWWDWALVEDLLAAGPLDKVYALDPESSVVAFGDGLHGLRPPLRAGIRATYEYGGGPEGLVAIDAVKVVDDRDDVKVRNPLPTWGAAAAESVADAERAIPRWLRHRDRLVTAADFRDITMRTPGVDLGRVDVLPLFDPRPRAGAGDGTHTAGAVTVMVLTRADGVATSPPESTDQHVIDAVCSWLDERRLITTEVYVRGPRWVRIWASIGIALMPGEVREAVEQRVAAAVRHYLSPLTGGLSALESGIALEETGASPRGWPLGSSVSADDLLAAATRVPGVRHVEGVRLAARRGSGALASDLPVVDLTGLELPNATVFVSTGPPDDPAALLGDSQPARTRVAVPVIPRKC